MKTNGLHRLPVISPFRTLQNMPRFVKNPVPVLNEYIQEAGETFCLYHGIRDKAMVTTNPQLIQYILQKNHRNYQKSALAVDQFAHFIGKGLLTSNGAYWLQQRRLIQPGFHRKKLEGLTRLMIKETDLYLKNLGAKIEQEHEVDIFQEMTELTFNIVVKSLFSSILEKEVLNQISDYFNQIQAFMVRQFRQPYLSSWFKLSGQKRRHEIIAEKLKVIVLNIIRQRKQSGKHYDDLLDMLIEARYSDTGEGMSDQQLLEECLILLIAGHETSANALGWTWYLLCQHPEVVKKIRNELEKVLGRNKPSFESLPKLVYLSWVLQEAMRLYPPVWITDRIPIKNDQFEELDLPNDRIIGIYIYGVHHAPEYWPDPEKFDPLRFTKEEIDKRPPFSYLPFGGGPRLCIGSNFAMMQMQITIAEIIQRYDFELLENQVVNLLPLIALRPDKGIRLRLSKLVV